MAGSDRAQSRHRLFPRGSTDGTAGRKDGARTRTAGNQPGRVSGIGNDSQSAGSLSRDLDHAAGGRHDRAGDREGDGPHGRFRAREPVPRHEDAARTGCRCGRKTRATKKQGREMSEEYLWDRSGPPDPEIERLERTLGPLRYRHRGEVNREMPKRPRIWLAAAAAVALAAAGLSQLAAPGAGNTGWQVTNLEGAARMGDRSAAVSMQVRAGQVLRTAGGSEISLQSDDVGKIDLGPDSELRAATDRKVLLQRGMLHAFIWAPPREFEVDTPGARAVDLGCEYTLNVDDAGNGLLKVSLGWVAFQSGGRESFIPAGAECVTHKRTGPGIPYYTDSSDGFREALGGFERGDGAALGGILAAARPRDGLT